MLPEAKVIKIVKACQNRLQMRQATLCDIAHVTGLLVSAFPAVRYLELYYRSIEYCKSHELHLGGNFDDLVCLSTQAEQDLRWIICNLRNYNGKSFWELPVDLIIECNASNSGWGATCNGVKAYGHWSAWESGQHINVKELQAAFFSVQSFYPIHKDVHHIRLKLDNSTAVANINKFGSIRSVALNDLSRNFWQWCLSKNIHVSAEHIPGIYNCTADSLSRKQKSNLEWSLNDNIFEAVCKLCFQPNIDLFASRLNAKLDLPWHWCISLTLRRRRLQFAGHCLRAKSEVISTLLLWNQRLPIRNRKTTYPQMLARDSGIKVDELWQVMNDRVVWQTVVMDSPASVAEGWWWWWCI